jgi:DNA-binding transcriptional ArsR family regulator
VPSRSSRPASLDPARVRVARANLLSNNAASLMDDVRVVFCEPLRTQIVRALSMGPLTVTELVATTGRGRTVVSQHLRILRQENLVEAERRGRQMCYALSTGLASRSAVTVLALISELAVQASSDRHADSSV